MGIRDFIESHGATCRDWRKSWSYINENERFIIFGAWDHHTKEGSAMILDAEWERGTNGRKKFGFTQAKEHIRLIKEGYRLFTFPMVNSSANKDEKGAGPAKISKFEPKLTERHLEKKGEKWYAIDALINNIPEEIENPGRYFEGASSKISVNVYERNANARKKCIQYYGCICNACGFDFEKVYGDRGKGYIHVHHIVPLSEIGKEYNLNPIKDLIPVCPNCHAIIHKAKPALTVDELRSQIAKFKI